MNENNSIWGTIVVKLNFFVDTKKDISKLTDLYQQQDWKIFESNAAWKNCILLTLQSFSKSVFLLVYKVKEV